MTLQWMFYKIMNMSSHFRQLIAINQLVVHVVGLFSTQKSNESFLFSASCACSALCELNPHFLFYAFLEFVLFACFSTPPQLILLRCFSLGQNSSNVCRVASSQLFSPGINCELALLFGWSFARSSPICVGLFWILPTI